MIDFASQPARLTVERGGASPAPRSLRLTNPRRGRALVAETAADIGDDDDLPYAEHLADLDAKLTAARVELRAEAEAYAEDSVRKMAKWAEWERERCTRRERFRAREGRAERIASEHAAIDRFVAEATEECETRLAAELATIDGGADVPSQPDKRRGVYGGSHRGRRDGLSLVGIASDGREVIEVKVIGSLAARSRAIEVAWALLDLADPEESAAPIRVMR